MSGQHSALFALIRRYARHPVHGRRVRPQSDLAELAFIRTPTNARSCRCEYFIQAHIYARTGRLTRYS